MDKIPKNLPNTEISKQLVRSAGSVGANYIEANEALSKKDFLMRAKISRKEAKESCYWIKLLTTPDLLKIEQCNVVTGRDRDNENLVVDYGKIRAEI